MTTRTILVLGGTGNQGGATLRHLHRDGWRLRVLTRDPASAAARALGTTGVELTTGDLDDAEALDEAMRGAYGVFSVQAASGTAEGLIAEERRGKAVVDAAARAGVAHLVYASVVGAEAQAAFRRSTKWEIERHLRVSGVPATVLRPGGFMEDVIGARFGVPTGRFQSPVLPHVPWPLVAIDDIGRAAALAFREPETFLGTVHDVAGDALTGPELVTQLSTALARPIEYVQLSLDAIRAASPEAARVFQWMNERGAQVDLAAIRQRFPMLRTFASWLGER